MGGKLPFLLLSIMSANRPKRIFSLIFQFTLKTFCDFIKKHYLCRGKLYISNDTARIYRATDLATLCGV